MYLKIILEILGDLRDQVGAIHTIDVMVVARIHEVIQLFAIVDAVLHKD